MPTNQHTPIPPLSQKDIERFYSRLKPGANGCIVWRTGTKHARFCAKGVKLNAHRVAFFIATGVDPGDYLICHSCDNPPCCNPEHLHIGTDLSNMQEAAERGRMATGPRNYIHIEDRSGDRHWSRRLPEKTKKGENHPKAKLTTEQALEIRSRYLSGNTTYKALAAEFGVTLQAVHYLVKGKNWKHI